MCICVSVKLSIMFAETEYSHDQELTEHLARTLTSVYTLIAVCARTEGNMKQKYDAAKFPMY